MATVYKSTLLGSRGLPSVLLISPALSHTMLMEPHSHGVSWHPVLLHRLFIHQMTYLLLFPLRLQVTWSNLLCVQPAQQFELLLPTPNALQLE